MDITVDRNNKHVIVATLQGGTIYTIDRKNDGSLGEVIAEFTYEARNRERYQPFISVLG